MHTSLLEAMMCKLDFQGARYTMSGEIAEQQGNDHPTQVPMGMFEAKDGYVNLAAFGEVMWKRFCEALGADELLAHPDYQSSSDRIQRREQNKRDMTEVTRRFTVAELVEKLNAAGVPCGPINNIGQAFEDEQVKYLKMAKPAPHPDLGDVDLVRSPINLSRFPQSERFDNAAPDTGQDSRAVLAEMGIAAERIEALAADGVIGE